VKQVLVIYSIKQVDIKQLVLKQFNRLVFSNNFSYHLTEY